MRPPLCVGVLLPLCALCAGTSVPITVYTLHSPPFVIKEDNAEWTGYLVELWHDVVRQMNRHRDVPYTYDLVEVADGEFGRLNATTGQWSGLVGELVRSTSGPEPPDRPAVALAPLTVTERRMEAIRFSAPFMASGIQPIARMPAPGARIPYRDLADVAQCPHSKLLVIAGGSTQALYADAIDGLGAAIHAKIQMHPEVSLAADMEAGVRRLREGKVTVALFETQMASFLTGREPCDLIEIGGPSSRRDYAVGLQKHADANVARFKAEVDRAILRSKVEGVDERLRAKWWDDDCAKPQLCMCDDGASGASVSSEEGGTESEPGTAARVQAAGDMFFSW